jgi:hypothetical protein
VLGGRAGKCTILLTEKEQPRDDILELLEVEAAFTLAVEA